MNAYVIVLALLAGAIPACSGPRRGAVQEKGSRVATRSIDEVLAAHTDSLMTLPGVVGTAIGLCDGERCIKVFLADSSPAHRGRIPPRLDGYRVVIDVTGAIGPR